MAAVYRHPGLKKAEIRTEAHSAPVLAAILIRRVLQSLGTPREVSLKIRSESKINNFRHGLNLRSNRACLVFHAMEQMMHDHYSQDCRFQVEVSCSRNAMGHAVATDIDVLGNWVEVGKVHVPKIPRELVRQ